jgi:hypothetical protein
MKISTKMMVITKTTTAISLLIVKKEKNYMSEDEVIKNIQILIKIEIHDLHFYIVYCT